MIRHLEQENHFAQRIAFCNLFVKVLAKLQNKAFIATYIRNRSQ